MSINVVFSLPVTVRRGANEKVNSWSIPNSYIACVRRCRFVHSKLLNFLNSNLSHISGSPYLVGLISESVKPLLRSREKHLNFGKVIESLSQVSENATTALATAVRQDSTEVQFKALQYSLFSTSFVEVLGGVFFLVTAVYILRDRSNVERAVAGEKFDW